MKQSNCDVSSGLLNLHFYRPTFLIIAAPAQENNGDPPQGEERKLVLIGTLRPEQNLSQRAKKANTPGENKYPRETKGMDFRRISQGMRALKIRSKING